MLSMLILAATAFGRPAQDTTVRAHSSYVVDSARTVDEELRRFRAGLGESPVRLSGGAASREALVRRFMRAAARHDTTALRAMRLSRAEFAYLVYPETRYTRPPYRLSPEIVWMQLQSGSGSGMGRLLRAWEVRGAPRYQSHSCAPPVREGRTRLWRQCRVRAVDQGGRVVEARYFGVIVERDGAFKFASLANDY